MATTNFLKELYSYLNDSPPSIKELFDLKVDALGLSQNQVESVLGIDRKSLLSILNEESKRVSMTNLIKIGNFIDLNFDETLKLFAASLSEEQLAEIEKSDRRQFIAQNFDLPTLKKIKFIDNVTDFEHIENKISTFFEIKNIKSYNRIVGTAFSRTKKAYNNPMLNIFVQAIYSFLERIENPNEYDAESLKALIPELKSLCTDEKYGLKIVSRALFAIGVTVVYQKSINKTQVRGATFLVNKKPCIVITNLNDNYATLWFALLHELYHVLNELDKIEINSFHLTGEPNLFLMNEEEADKYATSYFLSEEKQRFIYPLIDQAHIVNSFAEKNNIHPSFIYAFYCYKKKKEGMNAYPFYRKLMADTKIAVKNFNIDILSEENVSISAKKVKQFLTIE